MNKFEIGENIRKRRKYLGKNQEEIARRISMSKSQISKWENEISYPSLSDFEKLSEAMNIHPVDLVGGRIEADLIKHKEMKEKIAGWAIRLLSVMIACLILNVCVSIYRLGHMEKNRPRQYDTNVLYSRATDNGMQEIRQLIKSEKDDVWIDIITYQQDGIIYDYKLNEVVFIGHQTEKKREFRLDSDGNRLEVFISYEDGVTNKISFVEINATK